MSPSWNEVLAPAGFAGSGQAPLSTWGRVFYGSEDDLAATAHALRTDQAPEGAHVVTVDGTQCHTTTGVFEEFARALAFPKYFGYNWDAFEECLTDLLVLNEGGIGSEFRDRIGVPAKYVLIMVAHADQMLAAERDPTTEQHKLISVLHGAVSGHAGEDVRRGMMIANLIVLFHSLPDTRNTLVNWLSQAGVPPSSLADISNG